jgi:hypothetical protein
MSNADGIVNGTCVPPPPVNGFTPSSTAAWLYISYSGANKGDVVTMHFLLPNGALYISGTITISYVSGCVADSIPISGAAAASDLGTWTVQLFWNQTNSPIYSLNFTLSTTAPMGATISSVTTAYGGASISQNTYIVVKGINLVPANTPASGVIWSSATSFANGQVPTQLNGESASLSITSQPSCIFTAACQPTLSVSSIN